MLPSWRRWGWCPSTPKSSYALFLSVIVGNGNSYHIVMLHSHSIFSNISHLENVTTLIYSVDL